MTRKSNNKKIGFPGPVVLLTGSFIIFETFFLIRHLILSLNFPYPLEYSEGVTVNWILKLRAGESIYPAFSDILPWLHNPYTPLFYFLSAPIQAISENVFMAGRIVSTSFFIGSIILIYMILRQKLSKNISLVMTALFALSPISIRYSCMAKVDMPGLFLSLLAVYMLSIRNDKIIWKTILAGLAAGLAILVKPIFFPAALTGFLFLILTRDWKKLIYFAISLSATFATFAMWVWLSKDMEIIQNLGPMNWTGYSIQGLVSLISKGVAIHPFLFILLLYVICFRGKNNPVFIFIITSLIMLIAAGKIGADRHYLIFPLSAAVLSASLLFDKKIPPRFRRFVAWCGIAQFALFLPVNPKPVFTASYAQEIPAGQVSITPEEADKKIGKLIVDEIRGTEGTILSDEPGYILSAGRKVVLQPFQYGILCNSGRIDPEFMLKQISENKFNLIILRSPQNGEKRSYFPQVIIDAVKEKYYKSREIGPFILYIPE